MKYTSKYIEEIITSPSAKKGLDYITPIYAEAYAALWLMEVIGLQTDLFVKWVQECQDQILPQTATWLLPLWEEEYGLPVNNDASLQTRRSNILAKVRNRAPMNPARLEEMLKLATKIDDIKIVENTAKNTFTVEMEEAPDKEMLKSMYGVLDEKKPAHLIYFVNSKTRAKFFNENNANLQCLKISAQTRNHAMEITRLDGQRLLDGSWLLCSMNSYDIQGVLLDGGNLLDGSWPLYSVVVTYKLPNIHNFGLTAGIGNRFGAKGALTVDSVWLLNGIHSLNGERKLSASVSKEEL